LVAFALSVAHNHSNSPTLSGAQASSVQNNGAKSDGRHYEMYRSDAILDMWTEREGTELKTEEDCRMAMVLIALLGGGDYAPEGLLTFGEYSWVVVRLEV
jgi:Holliday junction resolvase YEN1